MSERPPQEDDGVIKGIQSETLTDKLRFLQKRITAGQIPQKELDACNFEDEKQVDELIDKYTARTRANIIDASRHEQHIRNTHPEKDERMPDD